MGGGLLLLPQPAVKKMPEIAARAMSRRRAHLEDAREFIRHSCLFLGCANPDCRRKFRWKKLAGEFHGQGAKEADVDGLPLKGASDFEEPTARLKPRPFKTRAEP